MTHVCRYWRQSIISAPENWTLISDERIGLTKLSLERCKMAPLQLWFDMRKFRSNPELSDLIAPCIQNTRSLGLHHISTSPMEEFTQTLHNFSQSTPNLRSLTLSAPLNLSLDWSDELFGPLASTLTNLVLFNVPIYPSFLRLRTLTDLTLRYCKFNLHIDTLLEFLEGNSSLEHVTLDIQFAHSSLRTSRRQAAIGNRILSLSIRSYDATDSKALISNIAVQRGAHLEVTLYDRNVGSFDVHSVITAAHLLNTRSPTFMEYCPDNRRVRLLGPNGSFSSSCHSPSGTPFVELALLPLAHIRELRLARCPLKSWTSRPHPLVFPPLSFPALEKLVVERELIASRLLSALFSNPGSPPSLKTLAFLDCHLDDSFIEELTQFSSNRKNTASTCLHRVIMVGSRGDLPRVALIDELRKYVPVVDVRIGRELPLDMR